MMRVSVWLTQFGHKWKLLCANLHSSKSSFLSTVIIAVELGWLNINERTVISKNSFSGSLRLGGARFRVDGAAIDYAFRILFQFGGDSNYISSTMTEPVELGILFP